MIKIDFERLKYADIEVVNSNPTPEELREISALLKTHRAKQARLGGSTTPRTKKAQSLPAKRRNVRTAGK